MPNKMLIDASHPEETRVVVVRGNRIEEFDFESQDKKQLKGNIYLARVTRVEPSLQAAFVEYGGNRHGFLAFSEIHPDYYQIPVADRQALLRAEAEDAAAEEDEEDERAERGRGRRRRGGRRQRGDRPETANADSESASADETDSDAVVDADESDTSDETGEDGAPDAMAHAASGDVIAEEVSSKYGIEDADASEVESVGADDAIDEVRSRRRPTRRQYKIQEVIKRRQILLVQVVKEERGNKGAAITTYLSLAGRYSVLMPNTARGGGISRKITNAVDRKRLKDVVKDLDVPQGMGVILRTAGESRTKAEIKRDYEYLMRLWENVRTLTLESTAPALVYEEGSLIKRSVRDLYNKDIEDIQVAGEEGYREAKDFMRMLMPSHAKVVQPYRENVPLFVRYGVESQLDKMLLPQVTLKSGGYIIINQTEALVSIDVNSGRSTKEHSIEDTALQTNLEAAEEVARQLRLRDLAGLIVIDFIDMEENRNNRAVEKKMKDCLKNDRARIQVGRISHFGLLEMSRQRIRTSVLESTMQPCPHCGGTGHVRSESSVGLLVLRAIEEFLLKDSRYHITVHTPTATALYVLNHKRRNLADLEARFGLTITIAVDESVASQHYAIFKAAMVERPVGAPAAPMIEPPALEMDDEPEDDVDLEEAAEPAEAGSGQSGQHDEQGDHSRKRRKRRRRRGGRDRDREFAPGETASSPPAQGEPGEQAASDETETEEAFGGDDEQSATDSSGKKRRRGKRGGRRNRRPDEAQGATAEGDSHQASDESPEQPTAEQEPVVQDLPQVTVESATVPGSDEIASEGEAAAETAETAPAKPARRSRKKVVAETSEEAVAAEPAAKPARKSRKKAEPATVEAEPTVPEPAPVQEKAPATAASPAPEEKPAEPVITVVSGKPAADDEATGEGRKAGWWQRKGFF